jgi:hypothetical protein
MQRRRAEQVPYESLPGQLCPELGVDKEELSRSMNCLRDETAVFWWSDGERGGSSGLTVRSTRAQPSQFQVWNILI